MAEEAQLPPFNLLHYAALSTILYTIIIPGTPKLIQYAFVPVLGAISYHLIVNTTTGSIIVDSVLGCLLLIQPLMHFANIFLTDPDTLVENSNPESGRITEKSWWIRVLWTIRLNVSTRGVGWKHGARYLPQADDHTTPTSRWPFVEQTARHIACNTLISGAAYAAIVCNPALLTNAPISLAPLHWQTIAALSCGLLLRSGMDNMYHTFAVFSFLGGFSSPEMWPEMFGSILDAWSIGRFWSVTWHQMLKRFLTAYATSLTRFLRTHQSPPGIRALAESVIWLWSVFALSGFVHIGGEYMATQRLLINGGLFKFFVLQPVAIILERALLPRVMSATRKDSPRPSILLRVLCLDMSGWCSGSRGPFPSSSTRSNQLGSSLQIQWRTSPKSVSRICGMKPFTP